MLHTLVYVGLQGGMLKKGGMGWCESCFCAEGIGGGGELVL